MEIYKYNPNCQEYEDVRNSKLTNKKKDDAFDECVKKIGTKLTLQEYFDIWDRESDWKKGVCYRIVGKPSNILEELAYSEHEYIEELYYCDARYNHPEDCCRLATEEEKQKLFDAIKANGYKWNSETKTLEKLIEPKFKVGDRIKKEEKIATILRIYENCYDVRYDSGIGSFTIDLQDEWELIPSKFDINTLKPFDKVLVRDCNNERWSTAVYSHKQYDQFVASGHFKQCIPYEGNEHLLGTSNDCDNFYKTWE